MVDMRYRRALIVAEARSQTTKSVKGMIVKVWNCDASGTAASTALITGSTIHTPATVGSYAAAVYEVTAEQLANGYGPTFNSPGRYFKVSFTNSTNKTIMSYIYLCQPLRDARDDVSSVSEAAFRREH